MKVILKITLVLIVLMLTGCATTKYGCHKVTP